MKIQVYLRWGLWGWLALGLVLSQLSLPLYARPNLTIAYFTPRGDNFWGYSARIAQAASQDLGVNLLWYPAHNDPHLYLRNARKILVDKEPHVDAVIFKNYNNSGKQIIQWAEKAQIPVFAVEEGLSAEDRETFGQPREKYKYWVGELLSDDFDGGYRLLHFLADQAKSQGLVDAQGKVQLVAITGNSFEGSSIARISGLHLALEERKDVVLNEIVTGHWKLDKGQLRIAQLLHDYPETHAVWIGNDSMAVGAVETLKNLGLTPGKDLLLSSIGSIDQGIEPLVAGQTSVSIGGQFMVGAWALIALYDYLQGADFASESTVMRLSLHTFTTTNAQRYYQKVVRDNSWGLIDFRIFSKTLQPNLLKYDFSLQSVQAQLEN